MISQSKNFWQLSHLLPTQKYTNNLKKFCLYQVMCATFEFKITRFNINR